MIVKIIYETPEGEGEIAMGLSIHTMIENRYPKCKIIVTNKEKENE